VKSSAHAATSKTSVLANEIERLIETFHGIQAFDACKISPVEIGPGDIATR